MFDVLFDPAKEIGVLIDPDAGRALGPLISAPEDRVAGLFEVFVGGINADPAELHPSDLDHLWRGFVDALATPDESESGEGAGSAPVDAPSSGAPSARAAAAPAGGGEAHTPQEGQPNPPADVHSADVGEVGQVAGAGPETGAPTESAAAQGEPPAADVVATGALPPVAEKAPPAPDQPGGEAAPATGGIPKAPGA